MAQAATGDHLVFKDDLAVHFKTAWIQPVWIQPDQELVAHLDRSAEIGMAVNDGQCTVGLLSTPTRED